MDVNPKVLKGVSKSFLDRADSACFWEAWVGAVLGRSGLYIVHHPFLADGKPGHEQSIDLEVGTGANAEAWYQVEVKSVNAVFTCAKDLQESPVLLCSQNSFLRKAAGWSNLYAHFLKVSRKTGNIVWIPVGTPVTLNHEVFDSTRGELFKCVACEKKYVKNLGDFVDYVKEDSEAVSV